MYLSKLNSQPSFPVLDPGLFKIKRCTILEVDVVLAYNLTYKDLYSGYLARNLFKKQACFMISLDSCLWHSLISFSK